MMESAFRKKYSELSDKAVIDKVLANPHDEEAAIYLIYHRYSPLLKKMYRKVFDESTDWYEDCLHELFIYIKGPDQEWERLRSFEWRSKFGTWLGRIAYNKFLEIKPSLIGKVSETIYIDDDSEDRPKVVIPDSGVQEYEHKEMHILLMEAVSLLQDPDQKFVVLKRLQGYNSKEIALLMQKRWEKHGIVKYNKKSQKVVPDAAYVDVRMQRAKDNLAIILKKLM